MSSDPKDDVKAEFSHHEAGEEGSLKHVRSDGVVELRGSDRLKAETKLKRKLDVRLVGCVLCARVCKVLDKQELTLAVPDA